MPVRVEVLNYILILMKRRPKRGTVKHTVGKFEGLIPEGKSSVEFLKELREDSQIEGK